MATESLYGDSASVSGSASASVSDSVSASASVSVSASASASASVSDSASASVSFPVSWGCLAGGEIHLSGVHQLASHLTEENHREVLERAKHKSMREIAEISSKLDVPSSIRALPGRRASMPLPVGSAKSERSLTTDADES